jgi:putative ABC transport system ATP-binding protein
MSMRNLLLRVEDLGCRVGDRVLWEGISFDLDCDDRLAIEAPSGSGKTLLLRALAVLDPLQQGRLLLRGRTPAAWKLPHYRALVSYLPQRPVAFPGSVEHNLRLVLALRGHRRLRFDRSRVGLWLDQLKLDAGFLAMEARSLSGGERQVMALLRALQLDPWVLLLDEATSALDPARTEAMERVLEGWISGGARALIFCSHDAGQRERLSNRQLGLQP